MAGIASSIYNGLFGLKAPEGLELFSKPVQDLVNGAEHLSEKVLKGKRPVGETWFYRHQKSHQFYWFYRPSWNVCYINLGSAPSEKKSKGDKEALWLLGIVATAALCITAYYLGRDIGKFVKYRKSQKIQNRVFTAREAFPNHPHWRSIMIIKNRTNRILRNMRSYRMQTVTEKVVIIAGCLLTIGGAIAASSGLIAAGVVTFAVGGSAHLISAIANKVVKEANKEHARRIDVEIAKLKKLKAEELVPVADPAVIPVGVPVTYGPVFVGIPVAEAQKDPEPSAPPFPTKGTKVPEPSAPPAPKYQYTGIYSVEIPGAQAFPEK